MAKNLIFLTSATVVALFASLVFANDWQMQIRPVEKKYPTVEMTAGKSDKDLKNGVQYFTTEQREDVRLVIKDGVVYNHLGQKVPDSKNETADHIDHVNYVMDADGNFYLFNEYAFPKIRHSSIFAGKPVAGAGEISIKNAQVVYIDADSGHYSSKDLMKNVLSELQNDGVDLKTLSH